MRIRRQQAFLRAALDRGAITSNRKNWLLLSEAWLAARDVIAENNQQQVIIRDFMESQETPLDKVAMQHARVLSGMRPTGQLHLGHYHGVLKNWVELQNEYSCFFFVADWHALTTHYENPGDIQGNTREMVIDWLATGVNPASATIFLQSDVVEHAELHLLLSMITPLGWLERVPSYKDQQERLKELDLATYGFLGYPLLQSADILIYRAGHVPVGEDQVAHVEMTREIARRFNHIYGREENFEKKAKRALKQLGSKNRERYANARKRYQEQGNTEALQQGRVVGLPREIRWVGDPRGRPTSVSPETGLLSAPWRG